MYSIGGKNALPLNLYFDQKKKSIHNLKVMSFNINCNFSNVEIKAKEITEFIISHDPDVVFISELGKFNNRGR